MPNGCLLYLRDTEYIGKCMIVHVGCDRLVVGMFETFMLLAL
jgi:hypothetical protein